MMNIKLDDGFIVRIADPGSSFQVGQQVKIVLGVGSGLPFDELPQYRGVIVDASVEADAYPEVSWANASELRWDESWSKVNAFGSLAEAIMIGIGVAGGCLLFASVVKYLWSWLVGMDR